MRLLWLVAWGALAQTTPQADVLARWYRLGETSRVYVRVRSAAAPALWDVALEARRAGDGQPAGSLTAPRLVQQNLVAVDWTAPTEDVGPVVLSATVRGGGAELRTERTVECAPPFPGAFIFETLDRLTLPLRVLTGPGARAGLPTRATRLLPALIRLD